MERVLVTGGSGFIGSHLIARLVQDGHDVVNLDIRSPQITGQNSHWRECDIKDLARTQRIFSEFLPTRVIHLAAKANLNGKSVRDFPDNTIGTANIIACVNRTDSVQLFLNTSTQYVVKPGILPESETYLVPYTAYGESKAEAERLVRSSCEKPWIIIRPTNIWGPLHPFFPYELWRYLQHRHYLHPGYKSIRKYYGYIGNAINKLLRVSLSDEVDVVSRRVYYLTDAAIDSADWMNGFSLALSGERIRRIPLPMWRMLAKVGDVSNTVGIRFPMSSARLFRLTVNEKIPDDLIIKLPKNESTSLEDGIRQSVEWYLSEVLDRSIKGAQAKVV